MANILDDFIDEEIKEIEEELIDKLPKKKPKKQKVTFKEETNDEIEEMREQLSILSVLGTINTYTGVNLSLGDVKRLHNKEVETYYNRYQLVLGRNITDDLVDAAIETTVEVISRVLPIDEKEKLCKGLQQNEFMRKELSNVAGYAVLKGGRFVALASGLLQVAKHVKFTTSESEQSEVIEQ